MAATPSRPPLCGHTNFGHGCVSNALLRGFLRTSASAYGIKAGLTLAMDIWKGHIKREGFKRIMATLKGEDAIRFALFMGVLSGTYKAAVCIQRRLTEKNDRVHSAIAALVASPALLLDMPQRRRTIALYIFVRGLDDAIRVLVSKGHIPTVPFFTVAMFAICQIPILEAFFHYKPGEVLDKNYYNFVRKMGNYDVTTVRRTFQSIVTDAPYKLPSEPFTPCPEAYHPEVESCVVEHTFDFFRGLRRASNIYVPVHFLPSLIFRPKSVVNDPAKYLSHAVQNTFWSSAFLSGYQSFAKQFVCFLRNRFEYSGGWLSVAGGLSTGFALLLEHPQRHSELLLYVIPRALTATYNMHADSKVAKLLRRIPFGTALLFQIGMMLFMVCYDYDKREMKRLNQSALRLVFGSTNKS